MFSSKRMKCLYLFTQLTWVWHCSSATTLDHPLVQWERTCPQCHLFQATSAKSKKRHCFAFQTVKWIYVKILLRCNEKIHFVIKFWQQKKTCFSTKINKNLPVKVPFFPNVARQIHVKQTKKKSILIRAKNVKRLRSYVIKIEKQKLQH